jgi:hypothetical protein
MIDRSNLIQLTAPVFINYLKSSGVFWYRLDARIGEGAGLKAARRVHSTGAWNCKPGNLSLAKSLKFSQRAALKTLAGFFIQLIYQRRRALAYADHQRP